jgi:putative transposase
MALFKNKYRIESARFPGWNYSSPGCYFITVCTYNRIHLFGEIANKKMHLNEYGNIVFDEWNKSFDIRDELFPDEFIVMPDHLHAIVHLIVETSGRTSLPGRASLPGGRYPMHFSGIPLRGSRILIRDPHKPVRNSHSFYRIDESSGYICETPGFIDETSGLFDETPGRASLRDESQTGQDMYGLRPASLSSFMAGVKSSITKRINTVRQTPGERVFQHRFYDHIVRNEQELSRIRQYIKNNPANWKQDTLKL